MTAPTITVVYPKTVPTGGRRLVQIMGSGFQLPPAPPLTGRVPVPAPTVEVLFAGVPGTRVLVASSARLFVLCPIGQPGDASVTVRNVDQSGVPIPGESATATGVLAYVRPDLNATPGRDLTRIVRVLIERLRLEVLNNTAISVHTDYSDDPSSGLVAIAQLPALLLIGPSLRENRWLSTNEARYESNSFALGAKFFDELRTPMTVDLVFQIVGATDSQAQILALQHEVEAFFQRNKTLSMTTVEGGSTVVSWEVDWEPDGHTKAVGSANNSNIHAFRGAFAIRGFDIDDGSMTVNVTRELEDQAPAASVMAPSAVLLGEPEQLTPSEDVGPSPGDG